MDIVPDFPLETSLVQAVLFGCRGVEWIVEIAQVRKQRVQSPDHVLECSGGQPATPVQGVLSKDAQTDLAVFVDIWVPDSRVAVDGRRLDVVLDGNLDGEDEGPAPPVALLGANDQGELPEVVHVLELQFAGPREAGLKLSHLLREVAASHGHLLAQRGNAGLLAPLFLLLTFLGKLEHDCAVLPPREFDSYRT